MKRSDYVRQCRTLAAKRGLVDIRCQLPRRVESRIILFIMMDTPSVPAIMKAPTPIIKVDTAAPIDRLPHEILVKILQHLDKPLPPPWLRKAPEPQTDLVRCMRVSSVSDGKWAGGVVGCALRRSSPCIERQRTNVNVD